MSGRGSSNYAIYLATHFYALSPLPVCGRIHCKLCMCAPTATYMRALYTSITASHRKCNNRSWAGVVLRIQDF